MVLDLSSSVLNNLPFKERFCHIIFIVVNDIKLQAYKQIRNYLNLAIMLMIKLSFTFATSVSSNSLSTLNCLAETAVLLPDFLLASSSSNFSGDLISL